MQDGLNVGNTIKAAFSTLGENGVIRAANGHSCKECVQPFHMQAEWITADDPAAIVGVDENQTVPHLEDQFAQRAVQDAQAARTAVNLQAQNQNIDPESLVDPDCFVNMMVVDGIVMGPTVCEFF